MAPRNSHDRRREHRARRRATQGQLDADRAPVQRPQQPTRATGDRFARQVDERRPSEDALAPPVRRVRARSALPGCERAGVADRGRLRRRLDPAHGARRQPVDEGVRRAVSPDGRRGHELQPVRRGLLPAGGAPGRLLGSADVARHEARHAVQGDRRRALPVRGSGSRELHEGVQPAGRDARHRAAPDDRFPEIRRTVDGPTVRRAPRRAPRRGRIRALPRVPQPDRGPRLTRRHRQQLLRPLRSAARARVLRGVGPEPRVRTARIRRGAVPPVLRGRRRYSGAAPEHPRTRRARSRRGTR